MKRAGQTSATQTTSETADAIDGLISHLPILIRPLRQRTAPLDAWQELA
jgi:hypothetical protein